MFNPDCYLPSESFFFRYEKALMELSDDDLFIWLMHRAGKSQEWIAKKVGLSQSAVSHRIKKIEHHFRLRVTGRVEPNDRRIKKN
jgi:DNA-binding Lrp family transcriptional regulator